MKNFLAPFAAGLAGAAAAIGIAIAAPAPAEAGTCWFREGYNHTANAEWCGTDRRINANGHVVFDVTDTKGRKITVVMWRNNTAELIGIPGANGPVEVPFYTDTDGDQRFVLRNGAELIVRF